MIIHDVQKSDTLQGVALRYGVQPSALLRFNRLAAAQALHADGAWGPASPRVVTLFVALVDVTDESAGPTFFVPGTHAPRCFPDGRWRPPPGAGGADGASGGETWFPLAAGDLVAMDALCWHRGGANASAAVRRTLLCASFAPRERGSGNPALARFRGRVTRE